MYKRLNVGYFHMMNKKIITTLLMVSCFLYANPAFTSTYISSVFQIKTDYKADTVESADIVLPEENWGVEYEHEIIIIPSDGINIPIEIKKPTVVLTNDERGRFVFSDGKMRATTRTPLIVYNYTEGVVYNKRPTLYISIGGYRGLENNSSLDDGYGINNWQTEMESILATTLDDSQYKHFMVDWDSAKSNRLQVEDLGHVVNSFLNSRTYAWDVVIVGHSRGGVFGHDLTRQIVGNRKINNLHTFLLDPTAATFMSDIYPSYKHTDSPTNHYASLYYDDAPFIDEYGFALGTTSDRPIDGYTNYGRGTTIFNSNHVDFAIDWIGATVGGFFEALSEINSRKFPGTFNLDGETSGSEVVRIGISSDIYVAGDIDIGDGDIRIWAEIAAGPIRANLDAALGENGLELYGAITVASAHLIIREDELAVSVSTPLASYAHSISGDGVSVNVSSISLAGLVPFGIGAGVDEDRISITISIGSESIDIGTDTSNIILGAIIGGIF